MLRKPRAPKLSRDVLSLLLALAQQALDARDAWDRFPVFVWTTSAQPVDLVSEFGGACVSRQGDVSWLDERGLDWFVFNAAGRDDLHIDRENARYQARFERWYEVRSPKELVREPCTNDPAVRARLFATLDETLAARGGRTGLGVSLGDEIGLTPGGAPLDLCHCEHCERAWSEFVKGRGALEGMKLASITTDATLRSVRDGTSASSVAAWLARREFHERQWTQLIGDLARRVREKSPGTPVGLLGLSAQSAFGSVSIEDVLPALDFIECYRVGNARELAFTLRRPEQRVLLTIFDDARGPDFVAWQAWEHWMRGGDGLVVWSEKELVAKPALRERLARAIRDIRAVQAKVGRFRPEPQGVAVVHSQASVALSWLREARFDLSTWPRRFASYQEENGGLERSRRRWFEYLEDLDAMPGALPIEVVGPDTVKRFDTLALDWLPALNATDVEHLKSYVVAGGRIWLADESAARDDEASSLLRSFAEELREKSPDQLWSVPRSLRRYTGALEDHEELWAFDARRHLSDAPLAANDPDNNWNWIQTWMPRGREWLCAALPKAPKWPSEDDPAVLPREVDVAASVFDIDWIHPLPDESGVVTLPPGDALVFRLVPRR